jgi:putative MATE family efflux protein
MINRLLPFLKDKDYMAGLTTIALPIILQQAISSGLNAVDVFMLGQLGEVPVAAVGLANQISFLLMFALFGIGSGAGVFAAQYWGKRELHNIHKTLGIGITMSLVGSLAFTILAVGFPQAALGLYTQDPAVISAGSSYLRLVGISYLLMAVTNSFSMVHRSTGHVRLITTTSVLAIIIKSALSYGLIFGALGLPRMGIVGAGIATVIARALECSVLVFITYWRKLPAAASLRAMTSYNRAFLKSFLIIALPVVFNEMLWSLGISTYNAIYARIGTESVAAYNIASTFEGMAFVIFIGLMDACAIMVGNKIGAGEQHTAFVYARRSILIALGAGILVGAALIGASSAAPKMYNISPVARTYMRNIMMIMGCCMWVRALNLVSIVGVLRSGGDTRFGFFLDAGTVWLIGVPIALLGAFVLELSVYWVYLMVMTEEVVKMLAALWRFRSRRWMRDLTQTA